MPSILFRQIGYLNFLYNDTFRHSVVSGVKTFPSWEHFIWQSKIAPEDVSKEMLSNYCRPYFLLSFFLLDLSVARQQGREMNLTRITRIGSALYWRIYIYCIVLAKRYTDEYTYTA